MFLNLLKIQCWQYVKGVSCVTTSRHDRHMRLRYLRNPFQTTSSIVTSQAYQLRIKCMYISLFGRRYVRLVQSTGITDYIGEQWIYNELIKGNIVYLFLMNHVPVYFEADCKAKVRGYVWKLLVVYGVIDWMVQCYDLCRNFLRVKFQTALLQKFIQQQKY